ncbi:MAG: LpxL/LpxP family Kdo(2)-lipid IV(A) lauroyl/palmitoleoyl acyltransferase [Methylophaga sp.]|nr:LpxL/LpxP family Kdo(2)-lipid IV(A) lauroyl/palmitoleoyl acyltransferase [Methylophaga sp.]
MKLLQAQFFHPRFWLSWFGLLFMRLSIYLPTKIQLRLSYGLALLMKPFMKARNSIAKRNIELCFPDKSEQWRIKLLEDNKYSMAMLLFETALSWWGSNARLEKKVTYVGMEHLDNALKKGKGVILLTGHFTCMELGIRLMMMKTPCHVMYRQLKNPVFNSVMTQSRAIHSEQTILRDDPRTMLRALKKNKVVLYAPDQDMGKKRSIYATFFGIRAATVPATARIVKMSGATVVPVIAKRELNGHYTMTLGSALTDYPTGDDVADAQKINDVIEQAVRETPGQYLWIHRRFKTQPNAKKGLLYK